MGMTGETMPTRVAVVVLLAVESTGDGEEGFVGQRAVAKSLPPQLHYTSPANGHIYASSVVAVRELGAAMRSGLVWAGPTDAAYLQFGVETQPFREESTS
jgi:hypothetical protein